MFIVKVTMFSSVVQGLKYGGSYPEGFSNMKKVIKIVKG